MPLFTVTMKAGRAANEKNAISLAIHEASVKAGYPEDDMFQRFLCLEQADLKVDLMVFFGEIDRAHSSFGGGRLAPPVAKV